MAYVRTVKTASGARAVQIVHSSRRGSRDIEHIKVEAIVEITDEDAVIEAALADLEQVEFTVEGEREAHQVEIKRDAVAALGRLVDSFGLLPAVAGAQVVHSEDQTVEVNETDGDRSGAEHQPAGPCAAPPRPPVQLLLLR